VPSCAESEKQKLCKPRVRRIERTQRAFEHFAAQGFIKQDGSSNKNDKNAQQFD